MQQIKPISIIRYWISSVANARNQMWVLTYLLITLKRIDLVTRTLQWFCVQHCASINQNCCTCRLASLSASCWPSFLTVSLHDVFSCWQFFSLSHNNMWLDEQVTFNATRSKCTSLPHGTHTFVHVDTVGIHEFKRLYTVIETEVLKDLKLRWSWTWL